MHPTDELSLYRRLNDLYARGLAASRELKWDEVIGVQEEINKNISILAEHPNTSTDAYSKQEKAAAIRQIIETQEKIRSEILDWQADVEFLLAKLGQSEQQAPNTSAD